MRGEKLHAIVKRNRELEKGVIQRTATSEPFRWFEAIRTEWFLNDDLRTVWDALKSSITNGKEVGSEMIRLGLSSLYSEVLASNSWVILEPATAQMRKNYVSFMLYRILMEHIDQNTDDPYNSIATIQNSLVSVLDKHASENTDISTALQQFENERTLFEKKRAEGKDIIGFSTGYPQLDKTIDGIRPGHLWIIGGYTSSGKTFVALNIASHLINQGVKVSFYSLEMSKLDIAGRMLGIFSKINSATLIKRPLAPAEVDAYVSAKEKLLKSHMKIHTEKSSLEDILTSMLGEKMRQTADVFIIDYGQLIQTANDTEYDTMRKMAVSLQNFAKKNQALLS